MKKVKNQCVFVSQRCDSKSYGAEIEEVTEVKDYQVTMSPPCLHLTMIADW